MDRWTGRQTDRRIGGAPIRENEAGMDAAWDRAGTAALNTSGYGCSHTHTSQVSPLGLHLLTQSFSLCPSALLSLKHPSPHPPACTCPAALLPALGNSKLCSCIPSLQLLQVGEVQLLQPCRTGLAVPPPEESFRGHSSAMLGMRQEWER